MRVNSMKASHRLDDLVATKVMGWKLDSNLRLWRGPDAAFGLSAYPPARCYESCDNTYFRPSVDIRQAWLLVEEMKLRGYYVTIQCCCAPKKEWCVLVASDDFLVESMGSIPLSICRAALQVATRKGWKKRGRSVKI